MRIALCAPYPASSASGIAVFSKDLAAALKREHHTVGLLTPDELLISARRGVRNVSLAWRTFRALVTAPERWDVIHANQPHIQSVAALLASWLCGARFVVTYHSDLPPTVNPLAGATQKLAHRILSWSRQKRVFVSEALRMKLGYPRDQTIRIGVDFGQLGAATLHNPRTGGSFRFVFAGRQTRSKGFFDLLEALSEVKKVGLDRQVVLVLLGDSPPTEQSERNRRLRDFPHAIEDHGRIKDRGSIFRVLSTAQAFVLPSYYEGIPLALLEAMAVGCAPLVAKVGGIPEVVEQDISGLFVEPGDIEGLREAMRWMIANPQAVSRMGDRAMSRIQQRFNLEQTVDSYLHLYRESPSQ